MNSIFEDLRPNSFYQGMSEPEGYGAFDDYQLNERTEDVVDPCENCEIKDKSECCTADIILHDICSECGEHCGTTCDNCDFKN